MKINKSWIKYFILFLFTIQPNIFTQYRFTVIIYAIANIGIFTVFTIKLKRKKYKISKLLFFWILYRIYILIMMIINDNIKDIDQWGYLSLMVVNLIFIFENSIKRKETYNMLSAGVWLCIIYLGINLYTLVTFPNGIIPSQDLYSNGDGDFYFLGIKIKYTVYIICAIALAWTLYKKYEKKKTMICVLILSILNIFVANISTAIVCLIFFILIHYLEKRNVIKLNMKKILIITIAINIAVIVFNAQTIFSGFIEKILHKNVTLTGRTYIWKSAIDILKSQNIIKLIFGNGIFNNGNFVPFGEYYWAAHNQWLQNIFELGIIGTVIFCYVICYCDNLKKEKTELNKFMLCLCATVMFGTITNQFFGNAPIYIPFIILNYMNVFEQKCVKGALEENGEK